MKRQSLLAWLFERATGPWTESRLLSRKFWLTALVLGAAIGLDVAGRALGASTLEAVRDVLVAYLAVQTALDWRGKRKKNSDTGDDV